MKVTVISGIPETDSDALGSLERLLREFIKEEQPKKIQNIVMSPGPEGHKVLVIVIFYE